MFNEHDFRYDAILWGDERVKGFALVKAELSRVGMYMYVACRTTFHPL